MSESNPLVDRVDALLKRHQQQPSVPAPSIAPASEGQEETSLEELSPLESPLLADAALPSAAPVEATKPFDEDIPVLTEIIETTDTAPAAGKANSRALAAEIEAAVLSTLLPELDGSIDRRLNRAISDLLDQVVDGLRADLSGEVRSMVREAVRSTVAKEIAKRTGKT